MAAYCSGDTANTQFIDTAMVTQRYTAIQTHPGSVLG